MLWEFTKRFVVHWSGKASVVATVVGAASVALIEVPLGLSALGALVLTLIASYQLFTEQQKEIMQKDDEVWSARNGTNLYVEVEELPVVHSEIAFMELHGVYVVNRRMHHDANIRFTLIADGKRIEAEEFGDPFSRGNKFMTNPKKVAKTGGFRGYLAFDADWDGDDLAPFGEEGVRLEIRDLQTRFRTEIELPTSPDGVELIERKGDR